MTKKFKKVIKLIRQNFEMLGADIKAIKAAQHQINRRLDQIEAQLETRQELYSRTDKESND